MIGKIMLAVAQDRETAALMGILGALAGGVYALLFGFISPNNFLFFASIKMLLMVVVGGLGSIGGTFFGALVVVGLPEALRDFQTYYLALFGLGVMIILLVVPRGLGVFADWILAPWLPGGMKRKTAERDEVDIEEKEDRALAAAKPHAGTARVTSPISSAQS